MAYFVNLLAVLAVISAACQQVAKYLTSSPNDNRAITICRVGLKVSSCLAAQPLDLGPSLVKCGIRDALTGRRILSAQQADAELHVVQSLVRNRAANALFGQAFLAKQGEVSAVTVLDSGVQCQVVESGADDSSESAQHAAFLYRVTTSGGRRLDGGDPG